MALSLSPLMRFGTSTWTYEGWQGQVYTRQYAKNKFTQECLGEYCQYEYQGEPLFRTVGNDATMHISRVLVDSDRDMPRKYLNNVHLAIPPEAARSLVQLYLHSLRVSQSDRDPGRVCEDSEVSARRLGNEARTHGDHPVH